MNPGKRKRDIRHFWKARKNDRLFPTGTEFGHAGKACVVDARGSIFLGGIFERIIEKYVIGVGPGHHHPMSDCLSFKLNADHHNGIPAHRHPCREVVKAVSAKMDGDASLVCFGKISLLENLHRLHLAALRSARFEKKPIMADDNKRCEAAAFEGQCQTNRSAAAVDGRCLSPDLELSCFIRLISLVQRET